MNTQDESLKPKIICHANGERCHGCKHYYGNAPVCEFAEPAVQGGELVEEIKQGKSNKEIALDLPVSHSQVSLIRLGKAWRPLTARLGYNPSDHRNFTRRSA